MSGSPRPGHDFAGLLADAGILPVVTLERAGDAVHLAGALHAGGLSMVEITLRTPAALEAIERIARELPEFVVGAGSVLDGAGLARAADAGASFAVSPGATAGLYAAAAHSKLPLLPGVATASELMAGREAGHDCFKFFPAEASGGVDGLRALAAPFPGVGFCPTGGIGADRARAYRELPCVLAVGGSWMVPGDALRAHDWARITAAAAACRKR